MVVRAVFFFALIFLGAIDIKDQQIVQSIGGQVYIKALFVDKQKIIDSVVRLCNIRVVMPKALTGKSSWLGTYNSCDDLWGDIHTIGIKVEKKHNSWVVNNSTGEDDPWVYRPQHQPSHVLVSLINQRLKKQDHCHTIKQTGLIVCAKRKQVEGWLEAFDQPSRQVEVRAWIWMADKHAMKRLGLAELSRVVGDVLLPLTISDIAQWLKRIHFMSQQGDLSLLASPLVRVINQEKAVISAGDEVPYWRDDNKEVVVDFKKALLSLSIKPLVLADHQGQYQLELSYDKPGSQKEGYRSIVRQQLKTFLTMAHGDSVLLGGIEKHHVDQEQRCPYLFNHIPYIREVFCSKDHKEHRQSLYVLLTTRLIEDQLGKKLDKMH